MSAELDMSVYLDLFLQEAEEQLEVLERETLALEENPTAERLQVIFRAAHTLKGSSRAMGYSHMAELTHEMENVLDLLRNQAIELSSSITDALLAAQDVLGQMRDSITNGEGDQIECTPLIEKLRQCANGSAPAPISAGGSVARTLPTELTERLRDASHDAAVLEFRVEIATDCIMKFARAIMSMNTIRERATLIGTLPSEEDLEEERFDTSFSLFVVPQATEEEIRTALMGIGEIKSVEVTPWTDSSHETETPAATTNVVELSGEPVNANGATPNKPKSEASQTVRVDVARLDNMMNLVGELVIDRTRLASIESKLSEQHIAGIDELSEAVSHIHRITADLQDQIMKARMLPVDTVFNRFPRVVRDLAHKLGRDVKLVIEGRDTELDRSVIEVIGDPLLHILRNSIDHGIEPPEVRVAAGKPAQGTVTVAARHEENHIVIEISDDGKGIDVERVKAKAIENGLIDRSVAAGMSEKDALNLIFASGLSTATEVSEVSGRGVGMDIVRANIQKLGGLIDLESTPGAGSRFTLKLPLTLAILRGLLVDVAEQMFVIPISTVVETLRIPEDEVQIVQRSDVVVVRGVTTPLVHPKAIFNSGQKRTGLADDKNVIVVIVGLANHRLGLVVDGLIGEQEVVIKPLSAFCGDAPGVMGATILGNGQVALIMDVSGLVAMSREVSKN